MHQKTETLDGSIVEALPLNGAVDGVGVGGIPVSFARETAYVHLTWKQKIRMDKRPVGGRNPKPRPFTSLPVS